MLIAAVGGGFFIYAIHFEPNLLLRGAAMEDDPIHAIAIVLVVIGLLILGALLFSYLSVQLN